MSNHEAVAPSFSISSLSLSPSPSPSRWSYEEENEKAEEEKEEAEEEPTVGDLLPDVCVELFRQHHQILDPVLPWLHQELRASFVMHWWPAMAAESLILNILCSSNGLDSEGLMELMQSSLVDETETFVQGLINNIVWLCGREIHRLLGLQDTHVSRVQEEGPVVPQPPQN
ncbi:hypothetical protein ASZ78_012593 [Callipepla squamata]|uniref:Uncharacterized protein n=1 Tax=Callipepla squamata TaxID=9009 RepID=A0A226MT36_CALSU|nr:hypothetical protein ASZ78_012593 [Callipepla squamata]